MRLQDGIATDKVALLTGVTGLDGAYLLRVYKAPRRRFLAERFTRMQRAEHLETSSTTWRLDCNYATSA